MIAFCIPFVTVVVRSRLASINPEIEQGALDLGATPIGALRLVVLPLLWPSIAAASMLCFVLSFDDFVTADFTAGIGTRRCRCASTACCVSASRRWSTRSA